MDSIKTHLSTTTPDLMVTSEEDWNLVYLDNVTSISTKRPNVADAEFDKNTRIAILWVELLLGALGGFMVCIWLWYNRRRRSRVNMLILHVAVTDLCVVYGAVLTQLLWEYFDRNWAFGNVMCKLLKFSQSLVLIASNFMVVVLSIDRHQAIRAPLKEPIPVWRMTMAAWIASALLSVPMFFIFRTNFNTSGPFKNITVCESIFRERPIIDRQVFLTFISLVHFCVPFVVVSFCYIRIFLKIAEKANEGKKRKQTVKPGKVFLQSTASSSLPKAKVKTLKMTLVIVFSFILCVLPYHIVEAIFNFGDHTVVPRVVYSVLGAMATANSATNPYVFLLFNANVKCARGFMSTVFPCGSRSRDSRGYVDSTASTRSEYAINRSEYTMNTDITRTVSKYSPSTTTIETVEMTMKNLSNVQGKKGSYTLLTARQMGEQNSGRGAAM